MNYNDLKDEIQYLGYRATFHDFTSAEEAMLIELLALRGNYVEYEIESLKLEHLLSQLRR